MPTTTKATPRKAPAKTPGKRHVTPEQRAKLAVNAQKARDAKAKKAALNPKKAAPPKKANSQHRGPRSAETRQSQLERTARTKAVKTYLESLQSPNGEATRTSAMLTGVPGMKGRTTDPDVIEKAIDATETQIATETNPLAKLKLLKKVREWRALVGRLRENGEGPLAGFIQVGAAWCADMGYDYAMMRDIGVPAAVLKEAGIE